MKVFFFLSTLLFSLLNAQANCTLSIDIRDTIGPATYDYLQQAQDKAKEKNCSSILAKVNTPGGSLQSTRKIVELIMGSPIPFLCVVYPAGGHAGSAGAIILQACHVSGAHEATNLGAATPVSGGGQEIPEDLKKKLFEDTRSWVEGLAKYRERSVEFAREIILNAQALDATQALKEKAIDVVVTDVDQFLEFAGKQKVRLDTEEKIPVMVGPLEEFSPGLRHQVLQILSNPQWAYLIFMGSIGLLYFEMTHPGTIIPGVVGAMGLVISLMNFHMLDVWWGGVALIFLGVAFLFAELFVPSFGALGLGGLVSFIIGSLFLFDEGSGYKVPLTLILTTSFLLFLLMAGLSFFAIKAMRRGRANRAKENWVGQSLVVKSFDEKKQKGMGFLNGELWKI
ncbi:MAG: nodulation protein NfeD, partial [Pseudomonadota bacterium]